MKKGIWQLQDAKNKFSQLVNSAQKEGPQIVTKHGVKSVVVISYDEFEKISHSDGDLVTFFQTSPLKEAEIDLTRDKDLPREPFHELSD